MQSSNGALSMDYRLGNHRKYSTHQIKWKKLVNSPKQTVHNMSVGQKMIMLKNETIPGEPTWLELDVFLLLAVELATWPAALGLVLAATVVSLTANLGTAKPDFPFASSWGMLAWLRSSSQDPMVAARLASLPLLPSGVSEDAVGTVAGGTSACFFNRDMGVWSNSGTASEVPEKVVMCLIWPGTHYIWHLWEWTSHPWQLAIANFEFLKHVSSLQWNQKPSLLQQHTVQLEKKQVKHCGHFFLWDLILTSIIFSG